MSITKENTTTTTTPIAEMTVAELRELLREGVITSEVLTELTELHLLNPLYAIASNPNLTSDAIEEAGRFFRTPNHPSVLLAEHPNVSPQQLAEWALWFSPDDRETLLYVLNNPALSSETITKMVEKLVSYCPDFDEFPTHDYGYVNEDGDVLIALWEHPNTPASCFPAMTELTESFDDYEREPIEASMASRLA